MSLVDYAASSDEDEPQSPAREQENEQVKEYPEERHRSGVPAPDPSSAPPSDEDPVRARSRSRLSSTWKSRIHQQSILLNLCENSYLIKQEFYNLQPTSSKQTDIVSNQSSELTLPDALFLLNSPVVSSNLLNASDHSSRVAAAMAESAARKRDLNGSSATYPRSKVPKGTLPHSKSVPDTGDGRLLPPQLAGSLGFAPSFPTCPTVAEQFLDIKRTSPEEASTLEKAAYR
ncbi:UNVERIFIED_CONTAM: hypothetical protein Sangu_0048900 [Sesamum angustifolium]|uniref:Uncharacterized protein n=1 Tax=Sesamum angustifolium TaxID=2727405 RepID=A0AAW2RKA3_9LAMI